MGEYYIYTVTFQGGAVNVKAQSWAQGRILAMAEAIKRGWKYEVLTYRCRSIKSYLHDCMKGEKADVEI